MEQINVCAPAVTEEQAIALVVHHLQLAAMYFEATPDDRGRSVISQIENEEIPAPCAGASESFVKSMDAYYRALDRVTTN